MKQEEINKIIHLAKVAFCESCGCGIPRDTCTSLGTCNEHDAFARILREKLNEEGKIQEILKSEKSPLQDYVNENILFALDAQKLANLICQRMTLDSLVRKMRDAQIAYENAPKKTREDIDALETYIFEMLEAEKKVDNLLKNIEETK